MSPAHIMPAVPDRNAYLVTFKGKFRDSMMPIQSYGDVAIDLFRTHTCCALIPVDTSFLQNPI
jgi:hypothetical protein